MADDNGLTEQLWKAVVEVCDPHPRVFNDAPTDDVVAAVLPILRRAQAEAWDEGQMSADRDWATGGHARLNPYRYQVEEDTDG